MDLIPVPSALLSCLLLFPLRGDVRKTKNAMFSRIAICLIACILSTHAQSQDAKNATGNGLDFSVVQIYKHILSSKEVIRDLNLSPQQQTLLRSCRGASRDNYSSSGLIYENIRKDYIDIAAILNNDQMRRFDQLLLQRVGALRAMRMPLIGSKLMLTRLQLDSLEDLHRLYQAGVENLNAFEVVYLGTPYSQGRFSAPLKTSADRMAESILTSEQHIKWMGLQGKLLDPKPTDWR